MERYYVMIRENTPFGTYRKKEKALLICELLNYKLEIVPVGSEIDKRYQEQLEEVRESRRD